MAATGILPGMVVGLKAFNKDPAKHVVGKMEMQKRVAN